MGRPNVLLMIADDHRHHAVGAFGDPVVQTPTLDRLAERGTAFTSARIMGGLSGAVCVPTRACLHTGANVFRASANASMGGGRGMMTLNPGCVTLAETLRTAGYYAFGTGKWHNDRSSFSRGFCDGGSIFFGGMSDHLQVPIDDYDPDGRFPDEKRRIGDGFSTELFCGEAIRFLRGYDRDEPFFLYVAFTSPHDPRMAPPAYAELYPADRIPLPPNFLPKHPFDNGDLVGRDEMLAGHPRTPDEVRQHVADYYAMITHMDAWIARVLEALEQGGHSDDTVVVYMADHGLAVGQHGLMGKQNLYEHSIRVPLVLAGPGIPERVGSDALVYAYDVHPTICDAVDVAIPETVEATSLMPMMRGDVSGARDSVYALYTDLQRTVTDGRWKLIRYYRAAARGVGEDRIQLFDLEADPWEMTDLSSDEAARPRLEDLVAELSAWMERVDDPMRALPVLPLC